jgi:hypothetical protein
MQRQEWEALLGSAGSIGSELAKKSIGRLADVVADKWKEFGEAARDLEQHKRRITSARVTNTIYAELHALREFFLQHGLAEKNGANREFFDKWLSDVVVELRWTPSGGWTTAKIAALHADLEKVKV